MSHKILAIDDSLTLREFIQRCLARHSTDYQILLAKDGTEGLALATSEQPDLILLDFILPDMKGDEVCRRLQANAQTANLPVVLMSSSAADIKRTQSEFEIVIKAIAKPFTPELLCSTVAHSLRDSATRTPRPVTAAPAPPSPAAAPEIKPARNLSGDTSQFSLISVLLALEQDKLQGVLQLANGPKPIELYVTDGRPVLVTTRDTAAYMRASQCKLGQEQILAAAKLSSLQQNTGTPIFMQFVDQKVMSAEQAGALCAQTGWRLFAPLWTAPRAQFHFEPNIPLPPLTSGLAPFVGTMSEWAMESLRLVGDDFRSAMAWGEPTGIPAYTRKGYERIQQIPLNDEEIAFASAIAPTNSLARIAATMTADVDSAQRVLHRFLCLEIFDYWPASLLQGA